MESVGKFEFSRKDLIGHGAFAVVFKGRHKEKHDWEVAVKCINKKNLSKSQSLLGKEIKILKELKHDNIVRLLDYQGVNATAYMSFNGSYIGQDISHLVGRDDIKHEQEKACFVTFHSSEEMGGCVYLVMEYCNGGDLAEYLHCKGTLSEDTICVFLQQIAQAMKVLQSKGILHRDLKPQNILLCHAEGRRSSSVNTSIKIADFGFARHLQTNTMAATLCGSPMYMAPEVIMSQNYDAKADLWSIGTIVYQCLTGKAPFHASTPQELRLFYESNRTLLPSIPKETSSNLRHLLLGLLQRNHKQRISFDEFFHHPFLETSSFTKKSSPAPLHSYPSSGSGSSSSGSSTSQLASPQHSDGEMHRLHPKVLCSPTQDTPGFLLKEIANQDIRNTPSYTEDYVMVPAQFPSEYTCEVEGSPIDSCLIYSGGSLLAERGPGASGTTPPPSPLLHSPSKPVCKPVELVGRTCSHSVPIPVPTQIQNYQRMEQNLQPAGLHGSTRVTLCCAGSSESPSQCGGCRALHQGFAVNSPKLATGGSGPQQPCLLVGMTPKTSEQTLPLSTRTGILAGSPDVQTTSSPKQQVQPRLPNRYKTVPNLQSLDPSLASQSKSANKKGPFKRSRSSGRLSDMLLKATHLLEEGCDESPNCERSMDIPAPPTGGYRVFPCSESPPPVIFTMGCPSNGNTPPDTMVSRTVTGSPSYVNSAWLLNSRILQRGSRRNSETEAMDAIPHSSLIFHPPELPEDTLMEEAHTDALSDLRFTLAFVHCIMELASSKDPGLDAVSCPDVSFLEQSLVTDQISLLSKEWSFAEQLVLYMKAEEFLSSALHAAKENIKQGQLLPSATVKQVIRKLNELYKNCVTYCRSLSNRLQTFLLDKQKLMDRFNALTAEKLIYGHTVHMVQSAALDEMFHCGTASVQRYHKALLLMEGLARNLSEQKDIDNIDKCKKCIERRLSALQT